MHLSSIYVLSAFVVYPPCPIHPVHPSLTLIVPASLYKEYAHAKCHEEPARAADAHAVDSRIVKGVKERKQKITRAVQEAGYLGRTDTKE